MVVPTYRTADMVRALPNDSKRAAWVWETGERLRPL
jgi:hypothetical protein